MGFQTPITNLSLDESEEYVGFSMNDKVYKIKIDSISNILQVRLGDQLIKDNTKKD